MTSQQRKISASKVFSSIISLITLCAQVAAAYSHILKPLTGLLNFVCLCAQAAETYTPTFSSPVPWKMETFDQDTISRLAYSSRGQRHSIYKTATFEPRPVWTATAYHNSDDEAEKILIDFLKSVFKSLVRYTTWALSAFILISLIPWAVHNGAAAIQRVRETRQAIGEWFGRTRRRVERSYDDFINANVFVTMYVAYQRLINWTGHNKYRLIVVVWLIHMALTIIRSQNSKPIFLTWGELQRYIDQPIPQYMLWQQHGSHASLQLIDDVVLESAGPISAAPTTTILLMAAPEDIAEDAATVESRRKILGDEMAFCHQCKQKHCCEIYVH